MKFQLRVIPTILTLIGLAILLGLGTWQLGRYNEKIALEATRDTQLSKPAVKLDKLPASIADLNFRKVELTGTFDPSHTVLFKHRQYEKRPGFWLATPLVLTDGSTILTNRGWVPFDKGPEIAKSLTTRAPVTLTGVIHVLPRNIPDEITRGKFERGETTLTDNVVQWHTYDVEAIASHLPGDEVIDGAVFVLDEAHTGSPFPIASTAYMTKPYMTAERHQGYFMFWYSTAGALLMLYLAAGFGLVGSYRSRATPTTQGSSSPRTD